MEKITKVFKKKKAEWPSELKYLEDMLKESGFEKYEDNTYMLNYLGEEYVPEKHKNPPRMILWVEPRRIDGKIQNKVVATIKGRGTAQVMCNLLMDLHEIMYPYLRQEGLLT